MFVMSEAEVTTIQDAFSRGGEVSAVVELRRLFPLLANSEHTRSCVRSILAWRPARPRPEQATERPAEPDPGVR